MKDKSSTIINNDSINNKNAVDGEREIRKYDLCLILQNKEIPKTKEEYEEKCVYNIIKSKLEDAGLILYIHNTKVKLGRLTKQFNKAVQSILHTEKEKENTEEDSLVILIGSDIKNLKEFAAEIDFNMLLDAKELKKIVEKGFHKEIVEEGFPTVTKQVIKPFKIPYPRRNSSLPYPKDVKPIRGEDIFLQTAIPPDQGCFPISCSGKKHLSTEEEDLIPYELMYGKFVKHIDEDYPCLYVDPSLGNQPPPSDKIESSEGKDPFGEHQRLKLTAMMFQKVIKGILRQGAIGSSNQQKDYIDEEIEKDYIDVEIEKVFKNVPQANRLEDIKSIDEIEAEPNKDSITRRKKVIESIKSQLTEVYALHVREKVAHLTDIWLDKWTMPWNQPFHDIRNYFGEKIAIYYVFVGHYCYWLLIPIVIGLPLQLAVWGTLVHRHINDDQLDDTLNSPYSNNFSPVFSFFIALWAVCMLEFWKRKEKSVSIEWGTVGCEDDEPDRPTFHGDNHEHITSFIDGQEGYQYYPSWKRNRKVASAYAAVGFCMLCVLGMVSSIYYTQHVARKSPFFHCSGNLDDDTVRKKCFSIAQYIASAINAIQIQILNYSFPRFARTLTESENNRTDTIFQDSLTIKIFIFQFVNSFASFYYLAFFAQFSEGCTPNKFTKLDCMEPLAANTGTIYFTRVVLLLVLDILWPYLIQLAKNKMKSADKLKEFSGPEHEYFLMEYNTIDQSMSDYAAMALHFGYIALFSAALPLAGLLGFASALIEIKHSAWKLLSVYRRPVPISAEDIGVWQSIFLITANLAVVTNAGITCFTMTVLNNDSWTPTFQLKIKLWIFIVFQWVCYITQAAIILLIPDIPEQAIYHLKRNEHIVSKVINRVEDDDLTPSKARLPCQIQDGPSAKYTRETMYQPKKHPVIPFLWGHSKSS